MFFENFIFPVIYWDAYSQEKNLVWYVLMEESLVGFPKSAPIISDRMVKLPLHITLSLNVITVGHCDERNIHSYAIC